MKVGKAEYKRRIREGKEGKEERKKRRNVENEEENWGGKSEEMRKMKEITKKINDDL